MRESCEALYATHAARIARLCRLLLADGQDARDATQEVFARLLRAYRRGDRADDWGAWLSRVAVNVCRDVRRSWWWRGWRASPSLTEAVETAADEPGPDRLAASRQESDRVWREFQRLPRRQREVFTLRHLEGWSTQEVADALGLSPGAVKRHLFRAVGRMRNALGGIR